MINNRFNVVYHLLGLVKLLFYKLKNKNMEIENEKLLNLERAGFDLYIRNCGQVHSDILSALKEKGYPDDNSYTRFVKASINVRMDENQKIIRIDNPTGQCGLDTKFFDGIMDYLKNTEQ